MHVKQIVNTTLSSNTYIISKSNFNWVWLIDVGDIDGVLKSISKDVIIKGLFITHTHYDHIYGINKLIEFFPQCKIFTSEYGVKSLYSDKANLSYYHECPISFNGSNIQILLDYDKIELFENCLLETIETPGHDWSCLTFKIANYLFTGDSYIPNFAVVTKLIGGSKEMNKNSLKKIMNNIKEDTIICPGHGKMTLFEN